MILTGIFNDADSAEVAYNMLNARGYTKGEIFYAKLHNKQTDGRIVIGIRPRSQRDAEFFVNEWDTVFQHPKNIVKAQPRRDTGHIPQEEDERKPSRKEQVGDPRPSRKTVPGVRSRAIYKPARQQELMMS